MSLEREDMKDKIKEGKDKDVKYQGPPKVIDVIQNYIIVLGTLSLQYMGVIPNLDGKLDTTGKKDLAQAKLAIDTIAVLLKQVEELLDKQVKDNIENMLDELRLKFVEEGSRN